ncbi:MAG: transporter substrate-binding domain-containing protein [Caldilineaceae bacterium]
MRLRNRWRPRRIPTRNRCRSAVARRTKEIEPFVFAGDELSGFSIDLWDAVAHSIERDYEFVIVDAVTEQLDAVAQERADAAIAAISITQA